MPIVISPWEVRFKNHTVFGKTKEEALDRAKEEIEELHIENRKFVNSEYLKEI